MRSSWRSIVFNFHYFPRCYFITIKIYRFCKCIVFDFINKRKLLLMFVIFYIYYISNNKTTVFAQTFSPKNYLNRNIIRHCYNKKKRVITVRVHVYSRLITNSRYKLRRHWNFKIRNLQPINQVFPYKPSRNYNRRSFRRLNHTVTVRQYIAKKW